MLAERRRKQKWSLNPRGNLWSSDNNKFGQRLLEKMGWKAGCGLGVNLQGPTEHVRVSVKNDNIGLGFKGRAENVLQHQASFSKLLEELNGGVKEEAKVNSLEQQSQQSRARVHYRKYTRGKDLSLCSDKDLQGILGKNADSNNVGDDLEKNSKKSGVLTGSGGTYNQYSQSKCGNNFGFGAENSIPNDDKRKSKKKKSEKLRNSNFSEMGHDNLSVKDNFCNTITDPHSPNKTKKCKRKLKARSEEFVGDIQSDEYEEHFFTSFNMKNKKETEDYTTETLDNGVTNCNEPLQKNKCKLGKRKGIKPNLCESEHSDNEGQSVKVKKSVSLQDNVETGKSHEENSESMITLSETCVGDLRVNGEQDTGFMFKTKPKKKKRKRSNEEFVKEKVLQEEVRTGISKRSVVSDLGFKGSNIMCIKGYGVT